MATVDTLSKYLERWQAKATTSGLRNPLVKMPVKRFRALEPHDLKTLEAGGRLEIGTVADAIARNLFKNYDEKIRERGEQTGFFTRGSIELSLAGITSGGARRTALLPVWMRRLELRKQRDLIVAESDAESDWSLNAELAGALAPLGVDLRHGPSSDIPGMLLWLTAQIGNRGKVDTQAAYVGCFSSQHLVIRERLGDGRWRRAVAKNAAIRAKLLGEQSASAMSEGTSTCDSGIEGLGLVLPIDDSQLRVVQRAAAGESLVIQGPPGTGKSQTIANLVANALWNGKRVLVVCDKRTAIRQVEERLVNCQLGPALLNLHDEGLDKKAFLQQAAEVFPTRGSDESRPPVEALSAIRNELNARVAAGRTVVHAGLGVERYCAQAGLIRLRERLKNATRVDIPNWQSLSRERVDRLLSGLAEWNSFAAVAGQNNTLWDSVQWALFREDPNARAELKNLLGEISEMLVGTTQLQEFAATVGYLVEFDSLAKIDDAAALARLVERRPQCYAAILDDPRLSVAHLDELKLAQETRAHLERLGHPVDLSSGPKAEFRREAEELAQRECSPTWAELQSALKRHRSEALRLRENDTKYLQTAALCGLITQTARAGRVAQLLLLQELSRNQCAIPAAWWSPACGSPADGIARWRREAESIVVLLKKGPRAVDLPTLERISPAIWPDFEAAVEDCFNVVSYCLRYRNDRRVKASIRQIFPGPIGETAVPWLELASYALRLRSALGSLRDAAGCHPELRSLTEAFVASAAHQDQWLTVERLSRVEAICETAALVERIRLRDDLFEIRSSLWCATWENTGERLSQSVVALLGAWQAWQPPTTSTDDIGAALAWLDQRAGEIERFLVTHMCAVGDSGLPIVDAWDAHAEWAAKTVKLDELARYKVISADRAETTDWANLRATIVWRDDVRSRRGAHCLDFDHLVWRQVGQLAVSLGERFRDALAALERFFRGMEEHGKHFPVLAERLREILGDLPRIDLWCRKVEWNEKVRAWPELVPFWQKVTSGGTPAADVRALFCYNLLRHATPPLEPYGPTLTEKLTQFARQDEQLERWSIDELRRRLMSVQQQARAANPMGFAELQRLATLQRVAGTVRELAQRHMGLLLALKPAWLMSPVSLANLMDLNRLEGDTPPFDVVIFDEASQIPVTEGLLPLGFAQQTIIVGDDKQLPPTTFFATAMADDFEEADDLGESESLIEEFVGALPSPMLMAHYRSETPDLISFSNREFYDGKLEMLPPFRVTGVGRRCRHVPNGVFDSGRSRVNAEEARAAVDLVAEHVRTSPEHSLGVVAMNAEQADLIEGLLVNASPEVRAFCSDEERFFIRNLETVQGDEMDRIIVSLTYGPNSEGRFNAAVLGPIIRKGGHRRLNVALSRSRSGMTILTSMTSAMLAESGAKSDGFERLKRLLTELETAGQSRNFGIGHQRFEPRRNGHSEVVHCESPFEEQVVEFLENEGYELRCQYGVARADGLGSFRIDIVVMESGEPLLAVECDGAAYHRSFSARTRDRARQAQLERLGWRFHRIWSTNWWLFQEAEQEALRSALATARQARSSRPRAGATRPIHTPPLVHSATAPVLPNPTEPRQPTKDALDKKPPTPAAATGSRQAGLFDELSEMAAPPQASSATTAAVLARQNPRPVPAALEEWSKLPGWPDTVVGRRVRWRGEWGTVTRVEGHGRYVFIRFEGTGAELQLSADFIRMRAGRG